MSKKKLRKANKKLKKRIKELESSIESTDNDLQETKRFNVKQLKHLQEQFKELESYVVKDEKGKESETLEPNSKGGIKIIVEFKEGTSEYDYHDTIANLSETGLVDVREWIESGIPDIYG